MINSIWFRVQEFITKFIAILIVIGGRGIGKTYSTFDFLIDEQDAPFIYLRNTTVQLDECCTLTMNPFKKWNNEHNRFLYIEKEKTHGIIYEDVDDDKIVKGYAFALSTFENLRGIDLSDVNYCLFDEFMEKRKLNFNQFDAFVNFYETVNRNRELEGLPPFMCILLSNAQKLNNSILAGYNLIHIIEGMIRTGQKKYKNKNLVIVLPDSEVSDLKRSTANAQLIKESKSSKEMFENKFAFDSFYGIVKRRLIEYTCICMIDNIYIYKHKSNGKYYACMSPATNIPEFSSRDNKLIFYRTYGKFLDVAAATGKLEYSDFTTKSLLLEIIS